MHRDGIKKQVSLLSAGLAIFLLTISCNMPNVDFTGDVSDLEGTLTPTVDSAVSTSTQHVPPTSTPEPTATITPIPFGPTMTPFAPVADRLVSLSEEGPWLVYRARRELTGPASLVSLFISNADGSGRRLLGPGGVPVSEVVVSPAGDRFAYISRDEDDDPHLLIRLVPSGELETDISLVSPDVKRAIDEQIGTKDQILTAVGGAYSLSWSPSGHYLAFVAALEGTNTDVYRFDTWSNNIRQLTTNSLNAYFPRWSPDGDWVLHLKGDSIGGLTEMDMDGLWVVNPDGSETKRLYDSGGGSDILVAWVDGDTFYTSRDTGQGHYDLTRRKVDGSTPEYVYSGPFASLEGVSFDEFRTAVAFNIRPSDPTAEAGTSPGIYLLTLGDGVVDLVLPGDWRSVEWWMGKGVFLANGDEGIVFIRRTGEVVKRMDDVADFIAPSPEGGWMVSYGETGARVLTHIGVFIQQVYDGPVANVVWQPGDAGFFIEVYQPENPIIGHQLYSLNLSEWEMQLVDLDTRGGYFWMESVLETP